MRGVFCFFVWVWGVGFAHYTVDCDLGFVLVLQRFSVPDEVWGVVLLHTALCWRYVGSVWVYVWEYVADLVVALGILWKEYLRFCRRACCCSCALIVVLWKRKSVGQV